MNGQNSFDRVVRECMAATGLSRAEAERAVHRRYPGLSPATSQTGAAAGSGSAEAQLNALAKKIAAERRITFAQAYVEALNGDPHLYLAYLKEQEAKLATGALRG